MRFGHQLCREKAIPQVAHSDDAHHAPTLSYR